MCLLLGCAPADAAIAFGSISASIGSTSGSTLSIAYPASISAGDLLIVCIGNKLTAATPTKPSGWTAPANASGSGGAGADGEDSGNVNGTLWVKEADGTETGSLSVTITGNNSAAAWMLRYTKAAGTTWGYVATNGTDTSQDTSWSVTGAADIGVTTGDQMVACGVKNTNTVTGSEAVTTTGVTYGATSERGDNATSLGNNTGVFVVDASASSGTSSAAPVLTATPSSAAAGVGIFIRLRETAVASGSSGCMLLGFACDE